MKMSFSTRLKERRESLGMSRIDLSKKLRITASAIANYENGVSAPKTELLYLLFDALKCDANYLYQDIIKMDTRFTASLSEWDLLHKYRDLDERGRDTVDMVLQKEYDHSIAAQGAMTEETTSDSADSASAESVEGADSASGTTAGDEDTRDYNVAARSKDGEAKSFRPRVNFHPDSIRNEGDF